MASARAPIAAFGLQPAAAAIVTPSRETVGAALALLAAIATFAPSGIALGASGSLRRSLTIAGAGLAISLAAFAVLSLSNSWLADRNLSIEPAKRTLQALVGLALARQGLFIAIRAFGFNLRLDPQRIANTASARLARLRMASLVLGVGLVLGARASGDDAATLMAAALALSLGLIAPAVIIALATRGGALACGLALLVGIANLFRAGHLPRSLSDISLSAALPGAAVALLVGLLAAWIFPDGSEQPPVGDGLFE